MLQPWLRRVNPRIRFMARWPATVNYFPTKFQLQSRPEMVQRAEAASPSVTGFYTPSPWKTRYKSYMASSALDAGRWPPTRIAPARRVEPCCQGVFGRIVAFPHFHS